MPLLLFLLFYCFSSPSFALEKTSSVRISASIGENEVSLNGYTSPNSKVEMTGINIYSITYSNEQGYFEFQRSLLPKNPSELCIASTDEDSRRTTPVCIPPPPPSKYYTNIGPVILPPTITIDTDNIKPGQTIVSSGRSIPNSQVDVYFFKVDNNGPVFPKSVYAYSLPSLTVQTDSLGNYSLNLPTAHSSSYRLFSTVQYDDNNSPKSNTLTFHLPSLLWLFYQQNTYLIYALPLLVLALTALFDFLLDYFSPVPSPKPKRYLPAIYHFWPVKRDYSPALYPDNIKRNSHIPE